MARKTLYAALAALILLRLALPQIVKAQINRKLSSLSGGYEGEVQGVHLGLLRGIVKLKGLHLRGKGEYLKLDMRELAVDLDWGPLLSRRMLVAALELDRPSLRMKLKPAKKAVKAGEKAVAEKAKELKADQGERQDGRPLPAMLEELLPFRVDRLTISEGEVFFREAGDLAEARVGGINATVENLTNAPKQAPRPKASGHAHMKVLGSGTVDIGLVLDPMARQPDFRLTLRVDKLALKDVNPLLRSEFGVDVEKGAFDLVAEAEAKDGGFKGYVKPFVTGLELHGPEDKKPLKRLKEAVAGAAAKLLKNEDSRAVAAKAPIEGRFEDPEVGVWEAVVSVLRNAFVKALGPSFDKL
ncbi:MAG: DUF748 domain-containing protein [Elusimicrobia bacterium]|nr:DUF748 domain-containing protein [Elusimicrobiota bacterium]